MSINYNKIKELVSLLYEFVYKKDEFAMSNYMYKKLEWENIKIEDLVGTNFDYQTILNSNYDTKENFKIKNIFGSDIYKKILLKKYFTDFPLTLIVQKYKTNNNQININDITYELFMNQVLSEFVIQDKVPFVLLNICNFNIKLSQLSNYSEFYNLLTNEFGLYDPNDLESNFCFSVYEHYHSYITLEELIKTQELSTQDIKSILFQIFYIYAYLISKLNNFYHGDFTVNSFYILINSNNTDSDNNENTPDNIPKRIKNIKLGLGDSTFVIGDPKYICKLFNFRKSQISGFRNNSETDIVIDNPTYSMYTILKSLYDVSKKTNQQNHSKIKTIISNFIPLSTLDKKLMGEADFYSVYTDTIIPSQILLKNNFFSSFINMNFKHNTSQSKNTESVQNLEGGNINKNKKNIDLINMNYMNSDFSSSITEQGLVGYRMLVSKSNGLTNLEGGAKKKTSKSAKSKSKSKSSKSKSYRKGQSRQTNDDSDKSKESDETEKYEDHENIDSYDDDYESENDQVVQLEAETDDEPVKESDHLSIEEESENETLNTEGDDDNNTVPLDSEELGSNYKEIIRKLKKENKQLKKKVKSKKSKKSKKFQDDSSLSLSLDLDGDEEAGKNKKNIFQVPQDSQQQNNQLNPIGSIPNMAGLPELGQGVGNNMSNVMLPDPNFLNGSGMVKMKAGTNTNFNQIFSNLKKDSMVPILPEMQQYFDMNQIANMPQKEFSSEVQYGNEPKIMDSGLLNQNFGMKKQLPLVSDPSLANMAGINQFGNSLGSAAQGPMGSLGNIGQSIPGLNQMNLGSAMAGEFGNGESNGDTMPVEGTGGTESGVLKGGQKKKNFFLRKNQH